MNKSITILAVFQIILLTGCVSRPIKISDYYPLEDGSKYTFLYQNDEGVLIENTFVRSSKLGDGKPVYYFSDGSKLFGDTSCDLIEGCYFIDKSGLWTISEDWSDDLEERSEKEKQLLLSMHPTEGDRFVIQKEYSHPITLEIMGLEEVCIPAGKFKDCLKIKQLDEWRNGTVSTNYIWLAKSIGVVKHQEYSTPGELADFDLNINRKSEWDILRIVKQLAYEAEISEIDSAHFGTTHPGHNEKIYFSVSGNKSTDGNISTYKTISGVLDGIAKSVIATEISTQYTFSITIDGEVAEIRFEEAEMDIAQKVLEQFFSLPHTCNHVVEDSSMHWCSFEAPEDILPHFFVRDIENDNYVLWYSTGANSGTSVKFKIENEKVVITEIMDWIS